MVKFGNIWPKGITLKGSVVNRRMASYSWPNTYCVVFAAYQPLWSEYSSFISSLDFIHGLSPF